MTDKTSYLEARVTAGSFLLGLMVLLLAFEYFTSRYLSRFPDYRLSYLMGGVTIAYFLALRFINYNKRREMPVLPSAATSLVDLLAALGVVGLALEYGNYPVAFLLNVDPALYSFTPPGSISVFVLSVAFAFFIVPRAVTHFILPPTPQPAIAPPPSIQVKAGSLEELVIALEKMANRLRAETETENPIVDPRNAGLLLRLVRVVEALRLLWPTLEIEGLRVVEEIPQMVGWPTAIRGEPRSRWSNLIVLGLERPTPVEEETLTDVLVANPWAVVLSKRALRLTVEKMNS